MICPNYCCPELLENTVSGNSVCKISIGNDFHAEDPVNNLPTNSGQTTGLSANMGSPHTETNNTSSAHLRAQMNVSDDEGTKDNTLNKSPPQWG